MMSFSSALATTTLSVGPLHLGVPWVTVTATASACVLAGLRWLRVAQREHYLGGSCTRFATRWWTVTPANVGLAVVGLGAGIISVWWPLAALVTAAVVLVGPLGLALKGRTSPLAWTRRLRALAGMWAIFEVAVMVVGVVTGQAIVLACSALLVPVLVDAACFFNGPVERRLSEHFVVEAIERLHRVAPTVVAVTGSYGKTSTKNHIAHLVRTSRSVVATPASFNNRAGLARAINEHLADGTEVFIAEMGTYGPGEIADMCRWCPPRVAVITAIGPVHLERFGSEDRIVEAKMEIAVAAQDVVIQVDDPRLAAMADRLTGEGKRVIRCSAWDQLAQVCVVSNGDGAEVSIVIHGKTVATGIVLPTGVQPTNLACAIGAALSVQVDVAAIVTALGDLPAVDHRLHVVPSPSGFSILDDTYNSNPAGAQAALAALGTLIVKARSDPAMTASARATVVTPGMVELGSRQQAENHRFAADIAAVAHDLVVVGRTNRRALIAGALSTETTGLTVWWVPDRSQAVVWVREHLGLHDVVLYENDLPDHYP